MKNLMVIVVVIMLTGYLGVKLNVIDINKQQLHKYIPVILQWLVGVLLAALIDSLIK